MNEKSMTALVSCFSRAFHYKNNKIRIFSDSYADKILTQDEYNGISFNMTKGIKFFNPGFVGNDEEALKWIVDNQLSPSVLGRSAFCEQSLLNSVKDGCKQYLIFAAGYDTFAYRNNSPALKVFEIDRKEVIEDKKQRLLNNNVSISDVNFIECDFTDKSWPGSIANSDYSREKLSFSSLLGISYYLTKDEFVGMIKNIADMISRGSQIVFDYPTYNEGEASKKNSDLAKGANEEMKSKYTAEDIRDILNKTGFSIVKHLDNQQMTETYFDDYNKVNTNKMSAPKGVNYCLAIKN